MLNYIWLGLILFAVIIGGFSGHMKELTDGAVGGAKTAVELAIGLIGIMTLWLGVMRLAEKSGLVQILARALRPIMRKLFPDVPPDHPAMGSMILNIAANMLGLSNAATPLGLRAMKDLETLNRHPGTATNAMCTFLAINTSSVQLLPITEVAILASAGSKQPTVIIGTAFLATICSNIAGISAVKLLEKVRAFRLPQEPVSTGENKTSSAESVTQSVTLPTQISLPPLTPFGYVVLLIFGLCFAVFLVSMAFPGVLWPLSQTATAEAPTQNGLVRFVNAISLLAVPFLISFFPLYAALRKLKVYEEFVEGAKEGFNTAIRIIPFLVTILVAVGMFRAAGGIVLITDLLRPALNFIHFPPELVPLWIMRPLSGSGSMAVFSDIVKNAGPDNILSRMAATVYGSTETTFYVISVYFGSVAIRRSRHAIAAGLIADGVGVIASVIICRLVFG
ncbi:MAG: Nucleoside recognition domain protein [Verrucomicrobiales bacterium]|nr:Nucleoside recognition domain protein [Verrucomicrobiales bacterium]